MASTEPAPKSQADLYAEALGKTLEQQVAEAAQNKKMQLGLSLLAASAEGLKSGSPYFSQGIGASLAGGVNAYGALKKQEQDQAKDIMATRLGMYKYGSAAEAAAANRLLEERKMTEALAQRERIAEADRGVRMSDAAYKQILMAQAEYRKYADQLQENFLKKYPIPMPKDPGYQAAERAMKEDPVLRELYMQGFPTLAKIQPVATTGTIKQYNPKTNKVE